jgi:hypothetical protein
VLLSVIQKHSISLACGNNNISITTTTTIIQEENYKRVVRYANDPAAQYRSHAIISPS